jgi:antitoxin component of MazEF toxin-antitoxin module
MATLMVELAPELYERLRQKAERNGESVEDTARGLLAERLASPAEPAAKSERELVTIIIKSSDENTISLPAQLMEELNLREGDEVKAILEGETLRLTRLDKFLALRGVLADDKAFDEAMQFLERAWQSWTTIKSV